MNRTVRAIFTVAMLGTAASAILGRQLVTSSRFMAPLVGQTPDLPPIEGVLVAPLTDDAVDIYGNDISPAVAEYSLDSLGSPYEMHSPQTELPRLGSPKS